MSEELVLGNDSAESKTGVKVLAILPARGGSKGVPRKNVALLAGKPLLAYSIEAARAAKRGGRIVVSTEDAEIASAARQWRADVVPRPPELAADEAATDPVLEQVVRYLDETEGYRPDLIALLQPTSPLRPPGLVDACIQKLLETGSDSLLTVFRGHSFFWRRLPEGLEANYDPKRRPRRQDIRPTDRWYLENGSVYATSRAIFLEYHSRLAERIDWHMMEAEDSLEIDTPCGLWMAEQVLLARSRNSGEEARS